MKKQILKILVCGILLTPSIIFSQVATTTNELGLTPEQQALYNNALNLIGNTPNAVDPNTGLPSGFNEQVTIKKSPQYPKPNQDVTLTLEIFSTNLDKANIIWKQDGQIILQGQGEKQVTITAPQVNDSTTISAEIKKSEGGTISQSITIAPSQVEILYEAQTYTPPFYKGSSLFTSQSSIKFVAIPQFFNSRGQRYSSSDLVFEWKVNGQVVSSASGTGNSVFNYKSPLIQRPMTVSVNVLAPNSNLQASDSVYIELENSEILLYEKNPLYGTIFEKAAIGNFTLNRNEIELVAVPLFFNVSSRKDNSLLYEWSMNQGRVNNSVSQDSVIFRNEDNIEGQTNISIRARQGNTILQNARNSLLLNIVGNQELNDFSF